MISGSAEKQKMAASGGTVTDLLGGDRPSRHGKILGKALALLSELGRKDAPCELPEPCLTCAFREGTLPNETAGTGKVALDCVLGIDRDRFACHHGMKDGEPAALCAGYIAARLAPWSLTKEALLHLKQDLDAMSDDPDEVRAAFDKWLGALDPNMPIDVYQAARMYAVRKAKGGA